MKDFVLGMAKALAQKPELVVAELIELENEDKITLSVDPSDIGRIIGKKGRTIKAIRTLLSAVAPKDGKKMMVEVIEPEKQEEEKE